MGEGEYDKRTCEVVIGSYVKWQANNCSILKYRRENDMKTIMEIVMISDNGKKFRVGSNISWEKYNYETNHLDLYIAEIKEIVAKTEDMDGYIVCSNIEINRNEVVGTDRFHMNDMHNCNYAESKRKS